MLTFGNIFSNYNFLVDTDELYCWKRCCTSSKHPSQQVYQSLNLVAGLSSNRVITSSITQYQVEIRTKFKQDLRSFKIFLRRFNEIFFLVNSRLIFLHSSSLHGIRFIEKYQTEKVHRSLSYVKCEENFHSSSVAST